MSLITVLYQLKSELFLKLKQETGFSLFELIISLVIMVILGTVAQINYRTYKQNVVKDVHVLNTVHYITAIQNSVLNETTSVPDNGQIVNVDLEQLRDLDSVVDVVDPSTKDGVDYDKDSYIQIYNNNGALEYYISLKKKDADHYYIKTVSQETNERGIKLNHLISKSDVELP